MNRVEVPTDKEGWFDCHNPCPLFEICPNHFTASIHRMLNNYPPIINLWPDNKWYCRQIINYDIDSVGTLGIEDDGCYKFLPDHGVREEQCTKNQDLH